MARKANFLGVAVRLGRAIEADQRRAENAAIRQHNAAVRYQNAMARQSERESKQAERERLIQAKEQAIQYALDKTSQAEQKRIELCAVVKCSEKMPIEVDWSALKEIGSFPKVPPQKPILQGLPEEINVDYFAPKFGLFDKLFKSRREKTIARSKEHLREALDARAKLAKKVENENKEALKNYDLNVASWNSEVAEFESAKAERNASVDELEAGFEHGKVDAIEFFFDAILQQLDLPEEIELQWQLQYDLTSKILVVDFDLPSLEIIPTLKQMKYVVTRKEFTETFLKDKELDRLYEELLLQLSLRVTNDLYVSDVKGYLTSIVFNGIYNGLSKSTGKEEAKCIMSLQTEKTSFLDISIENVDPKTCFLKFKGVAGNKLSELIPIAPVIAMDRTDSRFVEGVDVSGLVNGMNLASIDWESFEHLIRELFEKEFATNGAEVRITQASRDGGVDAVMFDPDPIRGGKYVIQAKRYTNVVGVAAVRDLYGTLMNEGAVKGILVTTASYGADSYEFAKDKPITLISGSNLLHMLQKHGYQARIDIEEAKRLMTEGKR